MKLMTTVENKDNNIFDATCARFIAMNYYIQSSGRDNGMWWAVLVLEK
jgi:hypothetical protein